MPIKDDNIRRLKHSAERLERALKSMNEAIVFVDVTPSPKDNEISDENVKLAVEASKKNIRRKNFLWVVAGVGLVVILGGGIMSKYPDLHGWGVLVSFIGLFMEIYAYFGSMNVEWDLPRFHEHK